MKTSRLPMLAAATALLGTSSALGQGTSASPDSDAADEKEVEVVIVTARQREESLLDVPLAVSVTDKVTLERDQIIDLYDLSRTTPALEVNQTFGGEQNGGGRLRGLGTGVFNRSVSPSVAYQVDQAPQGNLSFRQLFDLQQVEVLRGPQGTLFGQGASAGVINITTTQPSLEDGFTGGVKLDYAGNGDLGSESGRTLIDAGFNVPLGDTAAIRLSGQYREDEGIQFNAFTNDFNQQDIFGLRAQLLWDLTPAVTVRTKFEFSEQDINSRDFFGFDGVNAPDPINSPPNPNAPPGTTFGQSTLDALGACGIEADDLQDFAARTCQDAYLQTDEAFTFNNVINWALDDTTTLTSVTSFRTLDVDIEATNFSSQFFAVAARDNNLAEESEQFSQEIRVNFSNDRSDLIVGGFFSNYDFQLSPLIDGAFNQTGLNGQGPRIGFSLCHAAAGFCVPVGFDANGPIFVNFTSEDTNNQVLALFADGTYQYNDEWDIFGGIRITDYDNETKIGQPNTFNIASTADTGEFNVSGRFGARYKPSANTTYYGSISTGYKPSAVVVDPVLDTVFLEEEESLTLEVGGKWSVAGTTVEFNAFHTQLSNFQAQANEFIDASLISTAVNLGEITSSGLELSSYGRIGDNLTYNAGYIYNTVEYPRGFLGDDGTELGGQQLIYAPKHKISLSGEYTRNVASNLEGFFNMNLVYKSDVLLGTFDSEISTFEGGVNVGASIGVRGDNWSAALFGRNLTERREPVGYLAQPFPDGATRSWPVPGITTRLMGLKVDFNF